MASTSPTIATTSVPSSSFSPPVPHKPLIFQTYTAELEYAPPGSIIIVPCSTSGSWSGYHRRLASVHPTAFSTYRQHVLAHPASSILGTCLLILPSDSRLYTVACLFVTTLHGGGRSARWRSDPEANKNILPALQDLKRQTDQAGLIERWHMYRSNTGGMSWEEWKTMMESLGKEVVVYGEFYGELDTGLWGRDIDDDEVPFIEYWYSLNEDWEGEEEEVTYYNGSTRTRSSRRGSGGIRGGIRGRGRGRRGFW